MTDTPADEIDAMDLDEVSLEDLSKELIEKYHDFKESSNNGGKRIVSPEEGRYLLEEEY